MTDDKVDSMRKQKDEELQHYRKEIERQKRFENRPQDKQADKGARNPRQRQWVFFIDKTCEVK